MNQLKKITAPLALTTVDIAVNLNGGDQTVTKSFAFAKHTNDAAPYVLDPKTYTSSFSMNISDVQGNEHVLSTYFVKTDVAREWNAYVFIDDRSVDTPDQRIILPTDPSFHPAASNSTVLPKGEISANPFKIYFDNHGVLSNVEDIHAPTFLSLATTRIYFDRIDLSVINPALESTPLDLSIDFAHSIGLTWEFVIFQAQQTWMLTGTDQKDTLSASAGDDELIGGMGADKMTGGTGADVFRFYHAEETGLSTKNRDIITDFKHGEGDKIDLLWIDADPTRRGDQSFAFIGGNAFSETGATGQLRFDRANHMLYGSTDADSKAEFSIQLNGVNSLVADDFVL